MLKTDEVRPVRPNLTQSMSVLSNDRQSFKFVLFFLPVFILHLAGSYALLLSFSGSTCASACVPQEGTIHS